MFRKIEIEDKKFINRYKHPEYISSELNFANLYSWKDYDKLEIYSDDKVTIVKGDNFFFPPICEPLYFTYGLDIINKYCNDNNLIFNILGITEEIKPLFPSGYEFYYHPEINEYIYNASDLVTYSGKKLHAKRNLVNQFNKSYSYQFLSYDESYRNDIVLLIEEWIIKKTTTAEIKSIFNVLDNLDFLECFCDCLFVDNRLVGFSVGTIYGDCGIVLFEKADDNYIGIYAKLVNEFAIKHFSNIKYINRQEDMGLENLRKSKMSYNPCFFTHKYQCTLPVETQLINIYNLSFDDSKEYIDYFFRYKNKKTKLLIENNVIISMLFYRDEIIQIKNQEYKACFIFAVATHPQFRKLGKMDKLIKDTLAELENEYDFAYLSSAVGNYYERFGFVSFGLNQEYIIKNNQETNDLNTILGIYNEYSKNFDLFTKRDLSKFKEIYEELIVCNGKIFLLTEKDLVTGYYIYDGKEIIEYCNLNNLTFTDKTDSMIKILNKNILCDTDFSNNYEVLLKTKEFLTNFKAISFEKY